jgi:hypothetical protein
VIQNDKGGASFINRSFDSFHTDHDIFDESQVEVSAQVISMLLLRGSFKTGAIFVHIVARRNVKAGHVHVGIVLQISGIMLLPPL